VQPDRDLLALLSRRQLLKRTSAVGLATLVAQARPVAKAMALTLPSTPLTQNPSLTDATLQAFSDTMIPGRKVAKTEAGNPIDPDAIAGVDPLPGAVEADALALYGNAEVGFDALAPAFLAELETRSLPHGADFLQLDYESRVQVCLAGLDFSNPTLLVWDAAAAVPFTAFCAAALIRNATWNDAVGYKVMGLPGTAPNGYSDYSYRRKLNVERTKNGSLP
jgi:hypothetical protein